MQEVNLTAPVLVQAQVEGNHGILMPWWAFLQWVSWHFAADFFSGEVGYGYVKYIFCQTTVTVYLSVQVTTGMVIKGMVKARRSGGFNLLHQGLDPTISRSIRRII